MENSKTLICILAIAVTIAIYLWQGGQEKMDDLTNRVNRRLSYWDYKFSLWRDTQKIKHAYRYCICEKCGYKNRIRKEKGKRSCTCYYCNQEINLRKKGKSI